MNVITRNRQNPMFCRCSELFTVRQQHFVKVSFALKEWYSSNNWPNCGHHNRHLSPLAQLFNSWLFSGEGI